MCSELSLASFICKYQGGRNDRNISQIGFIALRLCSIRDYIFILTSRQNFCGISFSKSESVQIIPIGSQAALSYPVRKINVASATSDIVMLTEKMNLNFVSQDSVISREDIYMLLSHGKMYVLTVSYAYMNKASFHLYLQIQENC